MTVPQKTENPRLQRSSSSFISKVSRLAPPTAQLGIASELEPSRVFNPGPGAYDANYDELGHPNKRSEVIKQIVQQQKEVNEGRRQKFIEDAISISGNPKILKKKSSIPAKKAQKGGFSGIGEDNPGPSGYNPKFQIVKSKSQAALFSKSKTKREAFPLDKNGAPGPQSYNITLDLPKQKRLSSIFLSGVPNCGSLIDKDKALFPGPGAYYHSDHSSQSSSKSRQLLRPSKSARILAQSSATLKLPGPGPGDYHRDDFKETIMKRLQPEKRTRHRVKTECKL